MCGTAKIQALSVAVLMALAASASTNKIIRTAAELAQALAAGYDATGYSKFDLVITVTHPCGQANRTFSGEDSTGAVVLHEFSGWKNGEWQKPLPILHRGDRLHAVGRIVRHDATGASMANVKSFQLLGFSPLPPIPSVAATDILSAKWRDRPVKLRGVVQDAFRDEIDTRWNYLVIRSGRDTIYVSFTTDGTDDYRMKSIVNAEIEIEGLNTSSNSGNRRMIGFILLISGWDAIKVITPAPANPFGVPLLDVSRDTYAAISSGIGRRRAKGRVLAVWHRDRILLRTKDERIVRVDLRGGEPPKYGMTIEAAGLPETDLYRLNLSRAIWRPSDEAIEVEPQAENVTVERLTTSKFNIRGSQTSFHGKAIQMKGIVRSLPSPGGDGRLGLDCDGQIVPIDSSACPEAFDGVEIGCVLDASGICLMETDNWRPNSVFPKVKGAFVVVNSPDDLRVLTRPSWWTRMPMTSSP